jgi:hypothetical protein
VPPFIAAGRCERIASVAKALKTPILRKLSASPFPTYPIDLMGNQGFPNVSISPELLPSVVCLSPE